MSFLYRSTPLLRTSLSQHTTRCFSTTLRQHNTIKDAAKKVDRTVSDQLVKGIEKGIEAKDAAAEAIGVDAQQAKAKAEELKGQAAGKAEELKGQAAGKAEELKGQAKGAKEEAKAKI